MKKLVTIATAASMLAFIACGPSAEEKAKAQHMKDSLAQDSASHAQAAMMKMKSDSLAKVQAMAHWKDSVRQDSMNKAAAPAPAKKGKK